MAIIDSEKFQAPQRAYFPPLIEAVEIDSEITLIMESTPPIGPGETRVINTPDSVHNDPYKSNLG
jgi:hypothetical protein